MPAPLSVLVVEDEPLIAMMLEDFLDALGHSVAGVADSVAEAVALVGRGCDVAVLDVHLRGREPSWPVADALIAAGIPFVVATGGHVEPPPPRHADAPQLPKPFTMESVRIALERVTAAR